MSYQSELLNTPNFKKALWIIGFSLFTSILAQNIYLLALKNDLSGLIAGIGPFIIFALLFYFLLRSKMFIVGTPYFSISLLLIIAAGTAIGTFITQNAHSATFEARYGKLWSSVFQFLKFDDVFHSWWYVALFCLLIVSLLKVSSYKSFNKTNLGFFLAHLSPIIIIFGFWVDYYYGFRGIIHLEEGESSQTVQLYKGNTGFMQGSAELPFKVQLDAFASEKFDPDYRLQIWQNDAEKISELQGDGTELERLVPKIIASFPIVKDKIRHIYGTDLYFRVNDFYPNFEFEYSYPENIDSIPVEDPGVMIRLKTPMGLNTVQLREKGSRILSEPHLNANIEFSWYTTEPDKEEIEKARQGNASIESNRILINGSEKSIYYIWNGSLDQISLDKNNFYPVPGKDSLGFELIHLFPDAKFLKAFPTSKNDNLENPVTRTEVWGRSWTASKEVYLYPSSTGRGGQFSFPESNYFLALESYKDKQTKFWRSSLSVANQNASILKNQDVLVNEPMNYKGYRFYQTDYDPNNPKYSGIGVSHEPGLKLIYLGFILLFVGCLSMFYLSLNRQNNTD